MKLAVVSHKICWQSDSSPSGYVTDGGFPMQMRAISELFSETTLVVPCEEKTVARGTTVLDGKSVKIRSLPLPKGEAWRRKISMTRWVIENGWTVFCEVKRADAIHTPIPGDIGTIGMIFALILRKPLFVRYCGNWFVQKTFAEKVWKWSMERLAGGRNVMLATGGAQEPPSPRNPNLEWIFSTSLRQVEMADAELRKLPRDGKIKLVIACRQEKGKGTDIVIESLPLILKSFPDAVLDVVGGGSLLTELKKLTAKLGLENRVVFHGKVAQSEVVELLKQAHLFCYPTASEGFPKVVLESLASGVPVITTKVSVLPMLIEQGGGVLLDEPSPARLTEAVREICSDDGKYNRMSAQAIATAEQYSLEKWRDSIGATLCRQWKVSSLSATYRNSTAEFLPNQ